jgi:hypothetical protein
MSYLQLLNYYFLVNLIGNLKLIRNDVFTTLLLTLVGNAVAQLIEALPYKPEGRGFDSRWYHWNFSLT